MQPGLGDNFSGGLAFSENPVQNNLQFKYTFSLSHFYKPSKKNKNGKEKNTNGHYQSQLCGD